MSLIVGRVQNKKVIILGETKISFNDGRNSNPFVDGCLKQYIVNERLAFAFAGVIEHAEDIIERLLACKNSKDLSSTALNLITSRKLKIDLLISEIGEDFLTLIKDRKISQSTVGYIGDKDAFEKYQEHMLINTFSPPAENRFSGSMKLLPSPPWDNNMYSRMFSAFKDTISGNYLHTVGGLPIPLCSHDGIFKFMLYLDILSDPLEFPTKSNASIPIPFGTARNGGCTIEFSDATPNGGSANSIGFYFLQGGFGLVYIENSYRLRISKIIKADNPAVWVLKTADEYGVALSCGVMNKYHCKAAGERYLSDRSYLLARRCYELAEQFKDLRTNDSFYDEFVAGYSLTLAYLGHIDQALSQLDNMRKTSQQNLACDLMYNQIINNITPRIK